MRWMLSRTIVLFSGVVDCMNVLFIGLDVMNDGLNGGLYGWTIYLDA